MRQNRRRYARTTSLNHGLVAFFAAFALVTALGALGALSVKTSMNRTGREITRLEAELRDLREERTRAEARWSVCASPEQLDAALARHGLKMTLARGEHIVSLRGQPAPRVFHMGTAEVASNGALQGN